METYAVAREHLNPQLEIEGVVLTMFDGRTNLSRQVSAEAKEVFGDNLFTTVIPRNIRLSESPSFGQPIITYDRDSTGSIAYRNLAKELASRLEIRSTVSAGQTPSPQSDEVSDLEQKSAVNS